MCEHVQMAPFSRRIDGDGWPNRRNKVAFSSFYGVVWTGLRSTFVQHICKCPCCNYVLLTTLY